MRSLGASWAGDRRRIFRRRLSVPAAPSSAPGTLIQGMHMLDIVFIALSLGLFAVAIAYGYACENL